MKYALGIAVSLLLSVGFAPASFAADCPGADSPVSDTGPAREAVLCLVNAERATAGAGPLARESRLDASAQAYAERMVAERFFSHTDPAGGTFMDRLRSSGYADGSFYVGGENLGLLTGVATPRAVVAAWLKSPAHGANMLDQRYRDTGIGVVPGTPLAVAGATFAQQFGARVTGSGADVNRSAGTGDAGKKSQRKSARKHAHSKHRTRHRSSKRQVGASPL